MSEKIELTYYTAGAIEAAKKGELVWCKEIKELLGGYPKIVGYLPIEKEKQKTGKESKEQCKYITGLKQAGRYDLFNPEMDKIWWGQINPVGDKIEILRFLRMRKCVDGNTIPEMDYWGDYEAVVRSDFIVANIRKSIPTVGTYGEIFLCYLFGIPVYLITDVSKTDTNSTLLHWVLGSGGEVSYSIKECAKFIKEKYKI